MTLAEIKNLDEGTELTLLLDSVLPAATHSIPVTYSGIDQVGGYVRVMDSIGAYHYVAPGKTHRLARR